jgi:uncharacterized phage protein (TIGR01671 family)
MNREIKFRAWQKHHKRMLEVIGLRYENNELTEIGVKYPDGHIPRRVYYSKNNSDFYLYNNKGDCTFELMQYTGLKDKNGKEIYDGDICESIDGIFLVTWNEEKSAFIMVFQDGERLYLEEMREDTKIIGNINDNFDLLN